eukprot:5821260-Prymnesium_polylepis.2
MVRQHVFEGHQDARLHDHRDAARANTLLKPVAPAISARREAEACLLVVFARQAAVDAEARAVAVMLPHQLAHTARVVQRVRVRNGAGPKELTPPRAADSAVGAAGCGGSRGVPAGLRAHIRIASPRHPWRHDHVVRSCARQLLGSRLSGRRRHPRVRRVHVRPRHREAPVCHVDW